MDENEEIVYEETKKMVNIIKMTVLGSRVRDKIVDISMFYNVTNEQIINAISLYGR